MKKLAVYLPLACALVLGALVVMNAGSRFGRACEAIAQAAVSAPSTYVLVSSVERKLIGATSIDLAFDAQNAFGVPIRAHMTCEFDRDLSRVMGRSVLVKLVADGVAAPQSGLLIGQQIVDGQPTFPWQ